MDKIIRLRVARRSARIWARRAADARTAKQLVDEPISVEANHPAGAVLAVGVEESMAFDNEPESIAERRECIERPMRLELGTQLHQPQLRLPFLATLGSAAPFIGSSGTVRGIMRGFNAIAAAQNTSLSVVAAGHRRRSFRDRDGARRGNPRGGGLQQIHRGDRPLLRDNARAQRPQQWSLEPHSQRRLNVALSLPPPGESGEEQYVPLAEINVMPMVDVMIVPLIFMVAAPLLTAGVPINLLKTSAAQVTEPQELRVGSMKAAGETLIGGNQVAGNDLRAQPSTLAAQGLTRIVYVRGVREIQYGTLMDLLGLVNTAGFTKVSLLAERFEPAVTPP